MIFRIRASDRYRKVIPNFINKNLWKIAFPVEFGITIFSVQLTLSRIRYKSGKQCICTHKMHFCLLGYLPIPQNQSEI